MYLKADYCCLYSFLVFIILQQSVKNVVDTILHDRGTCCNLKKHGHFLVRFKPQEVNKFLQDEKLEKHVVAYTNTTY